MNLKDAVEIYWKCDQDREDPGGCNGCPLARKIRLGQRYLTITPCRLLGEVEIGVVEIEVSEWAGK